MTIDLDKAPLGKKSAYIDNYDPSLLFPLPRATKRQELGIREEKLPFFGSDIWTGFELSWLNDKAKPQVVMATFEFPCNSPNLIESKSFKLYLNSFNNSRFTSHAQVKQQIVSDLSTAAGAPVSVNFFNENDIVGQTIRRLDGLCLDELDIECSHFTVDNSLLTPQSATVVEETLYSNLLKSNCLVTGQPDWGSIQISYHGAQINHENLLKYIVSFRNHNEFHEQCVERIFNDIMQTAKPQSLTVYARYTRRGGLDINPLRSTETLSLNNEDLLLRLYRQ